MDVILLDSLSHSSLSSCTMQRESIYRKFIPSLAVKTTASLKVLGKDDMGIALWKAANVARVVTKGRGPAPQQ